MVFHFFFFSGEGYICGLFYVHFELSVVISPETQVFASAAQADKSPDRMEQSLLKLTKRGTLLLSDRGLGSEPAIKKILGL